jgi:hypothetical protein
MSPTRRTTICVAAALAMVMLASGVDARGGGRGGGARGGSARIGGGGGRGSAGFNRSGPAGSGSFRGKRAAGGVNRRGFNYRGPAADGDLRTHYQRLDEPYDQRQERREERQDRREARRDDFDPEAIERLEAWHQYVDEHYDDYDGIYYDEYYDMDELWYDAPPCAATVMATGGTVYYVCGAEWYVRAYIDGYVMYMLVPSPLGH